MLKLGGKVTFCGSFTAMFSVTRPPFAIALLQRIAKNNSLPWFNLFLCSIKARSTGGGSPPLSLPARNAPPRAITHYRVSVYNFAPTWDQFILISILIGAARRQFVALPAARLAQGCPPKVRRWVFSKAPRKRLVNYGLALHQGLFPPGAAPDLEPLQVGAPPPCSFWVAGHFEYQSEICRD